ncbi:hypothetical protein [Microvirga sp. KLBC 81]|uniref:hypothetical protein n=1 Tax=Microvirga sp. KLBC 81 TaxID=1862707 RepID=UPI001402A576|nr:hypothetical protein [Microvirga sp. KLBC 81]
MTAQAHTHDMLTLPVMAGLVPAIPMEKSAAPLMIGITGTGPVMTAAAGGVR